MIESIGRININAIPSQSMEQPRSSQKGPKIYLIKILESFHPDDVRKTRTKGSTRQVGSNVGKFDLVDVNDMDVYIIVN